MVKHPSILYLRTLYFESTNIGMKVKISPIQVMGIIALGLSVALSTDLYSNLAGAPVARSGAPFENSCATSSCHSGTLNSGPGGVTIESDASGNTWVPGQTYNLTVTVTQTGIQRWGFEVLSGYSAIQNLSIGTTLLTNTNETQIKTFSNKKYVTHRTNGSFGSTDLKVWNFQWEAPATDAGDVTFYVAGNAANNNGQRTGDQIYTSSLTLFNNAVGVEEATAGLNAMQVFPTTVQDFVTVRLVNAHLQQLDLRLMNMNGQEVAHWVRKPALGSNFEENFDISAMPRGLYVLEAKGEVLHEVVKIVKY